jgi:DNA mismatch repair protein MutS
MTTFESILFDRAEDVTASAEPAFFGDLHLDQILSSATVDREDYELEAFFYTPLHSVESVRYRHHIFQDLEKHQVLESVRAFAGGMRRMHEHLALAHKLHYTLQKERWFLGAGAVYCSIVTAFARELAAVELDSPGFKSLRDYLATYAASVTFTSLTAETQQAKDELAAVTYSVHIRGNRVRVSQSGGEPNVSEEVERAFAKFQQGAVRDYRVRFREAAEMNHIEAQIIDLVAKLFPDPFARLADYCVRHERYLEETIARFDREVQF